MTFYTGLAATLPRVAGAALYQLTIPPTNTAAERGFSVMKNLDIPNRRLAREKYTRTLLFLAANSDWYDALMRVEQGDDADITVAVAAVRASKTSSHTAASRTDDGDEADGESCSSDDE